MNAESAPYFPFCQPTLCVVQTLMYTNTIVLIPLRASRDCARIATVKPILSTFCIGLLIFIVCGNVGYFAAVKVAYRHKRLTSFESLGSEQARQFRGLVQTLYEFELSGNLTQNTQESLQQNIDHLLNLRAKAPRDVWPLLDLRIATDHAVLARLEQLLDKTAEGNIHRQSAETLLRSLGWQDVSGAVLNELANKQLQSSLKK